MNKKKIIFIAAIVLFLIFMVNAGKNADRTPSDDGKKDPPSSQSSTGQNDGKQEAQNDPVKPDPGVITIPETVLFDQDGFKIIVKELADSFTGKDLKLLLENNSQQNLGITLDGLAVNHYMVDGFLAESIAAGKKSNQTITIHTSDLKEAGINMIGEIELSFHLYDSDTYHTTYRSGLLSIHTTGYDSMAIPTAPEGKEIFNSSGIRIICFGYEEGIFGTSVKLYLENKSGQNISFMNEDVSVNGFMVNALFATSVYNDRMEIDELLISNSSLKENDIQQVDDIELNLHIFNSDTLATIADTGAMHIHIDR